ncbi:NAD-dependent succinate-semialdehyde dehydrogenase [Roseibium sp. SCP14]|uniref:NAD-dependent succinate-semialdehyde dehydrogenase n=1 Tax=Roseibium sp. SCP14 TaxID=3141375 RepID=UPI0033397C59
MAHLFQLYIDGEWIDAGDRDTRQVFNPVDGSEIGRAPCATIDDLDAAAEAAGRAFPAWAALPPIERQAVLKRAATLIAERTPEIARLLVRDHGKPLREALAEVGGIPELFEWFGEEGRRVYGRTIPAQDQLTNQTVARIPVGPVVIFSPWNFPMGEIAAHLAPALAAGCTAVVKAPEDAPSSGQELIRALHDAGLPKGVVNFVTGRSSEIAARLIDHPAIRKISFTGSTRVGKLLAAHAAGHMKSFTMELGGNAPVIVGKTAELAAAADQIVFRKFRNAGQVCTAPNRIYVHKDVHDTFVAEILSRTQALAIGDGMLDATDMGPLINQRRLDAMSTLTERSVSDGAELVHGGNRIGDNGWFFEPTVLTQVPEQSVGFQEEIFGPIASIGTFEDVNDVLTRSNAVSVGLASYVFSQDRAEIDLLRKGLQFGCVGINTMAISTTETPFGGVKDTGFGRVGGWEGLQEYLETKFVAEKVNA